MRQRLDRLLTTYLNAELLIIDELGFLPFESPEANFLFELVNARYQRQKSLIITSNKTFAQWEELFPDRVMAVALLDRLMHHGHIIAVAIRKAQGLAYGYRALQIRGESYRLKHRKKAGLSPLPV